MAKQSMVGYHLDLENHWVADLAYGHFQHVRHMRSGYVSEGGYPLRRATDDNTSLGIDPRRSGFNLNNNFRSFRL